MAQLSLLNPFSCSIHCTFYLFRGGPSLELWQKKKNWLESSNDVNIDDDSTTDCDDFVLA